MITLKMIAKEKARLISEIQAHIKPHLYESGLGDIDKNGKFVPIFLCNLPNPITIDLPLESDLEINHVSQTGVYYGLVSADYSEMPLEILIDVHKKIIDSKL